MTVMRDEINWPMAEIIKKVSDQNLQGIGCQETITYESFNVTDRLSLIGCELRTPSIASTSSGIAAKNRNTIRANYHRSWYRPITRD